MPNKTPAYLTDDQWQRIRPLIPSHREKCGNGKPPSISRRAIINAIIHRQHYGTVWTKLPQKFPKWTTVRRLWDDWRKDGTWNQILEIVNESEVTA